MGGGRHYSATIGGKIIQKLEKGMTMESEHLPTHMGERVVVRKKHAQTGW